MASQQTAQKIFDQVQAAAAKWRAMGIEKGGIYSASLEQIAEHVARCDELAARYHVTMDPLALWGEDVEARARAKSRVRAGKHGKKALVNRYGEQVAANIIGNARKNR